MATLTKFVYKNILKPVFFTQDAEKIHNKASLTGEKLGSSKIGRKITKSLFLYKCKNLNQTIHGIKFSNPIGLAAGFDYNGHMAEIMSEVGFGFNTIGTVTAKPYKGNTPPRLGRLPKSKSLLVNKGFKSDGVETVRKRLDEKSLYNRTIGVSIGSTNIPEINTISKAIDDYLISFEKLKNRKYINYFELNISCPNASMNESFGSEKNLEKLLQEIKKLYIKKPIFIKMANEISPEKANKLIRIGIKNNIQGYIFSNLVKDRSNPAFEKSEIEKISKLKGNFSGKPTQKNSNKLIKHAYKYFRKNITIIGCGGVFSAQDAYEKIKLGASLVQLITGMIYEGPQLIGEINKNLAQYIKQDGFSNISEAVGIENQ